MKGVGRSYVTALANSKWGHRDSTQRRLLADASSDEDSDQPQRSPRKSAAKFVPVGQGCPSPHRSGCGAAQSTDCFHSTTTAIYYPPPNLVSSTARPNEPPQPQAADRVSPARIDPWTRFKPDKQSMGDSLWSIPTDSNAPWVNVKGPDTKGVWESNGGQSKETSSPKAPRKVRVKKSSRDGVAAVSPPTGNGAKVAPHSPEPPATDAPRRRTSPKKREKGTEKQCPDKEPRDKPLVHGAKETAVSVPPPESSPRRKRSSPSNKAVVPLKCDIRHALQTPVLDDDTERERHSTLGTPSSRPSSPQRRSSSRPSSPQRRSPRDVDGHASKRWVVDDAPTGPPASPRPSKRRSSRVTSPKRHSRGHVDVDPNGDTAENPVVSTTVPRHEAFVAAVPPATIPLPEALESLALANANSKTIHSMRSIEDDNITHLDEIMNRVGWTTIVLKEDPSHTAATPRTRISGDATTSPVPHLVELTGSDGRMSALGSSGLFEAPPTPTLDLVPHVVALDDDLDGENSVFHPCPLVLLDVSDAPEPISPPPPVRRVSPARRNSKVTHLMDGEAFRRALESSCSTPLQLASYDLSPPNGKEVWNRPLGMASELDVFVEPTVAGAQRRKQASQGEKSPVARRQSINANSAMVSPRKRHSVSTRIGKRIGSHERMHGSDSALPRILFDMNDEPSAAVPSFDEARRRARRLAKEIDTDDETIRQQTNAAPRSPMRRRHSSHWRDKEQSSRHLSPRKLQESVALESPTREKPHMKRMPLPSLEMEESAEEKVENVPVSSARREDKVRRRTREVSSRRLSASIMQELQASPKGEPEPVPDVVPRFSVLRRIALFSKASDASKATPAASSPRASSRPSIQHRSQSSGKMDCTMDMSFQNSQGDLHWEAGAATARLNVPRSPTKTTTKIGLPPLKYPSHRTGSSPDAAKSDAVTGLSYRDRQLDALCRVPPRTVSKTLENTISVKERMALFQEAATTSTAKKGQRRRNAIQECRPSLDDPKKPKADPETRERERQHVDDDNSSTMSDMSSPS